MSWCMQTISHAHVQYMKMYNVHTWYTPNQSNHILHSTSCPNRFSWPTQICSMEWSPSALFYKGGWGWGQSLSRARHYWNWGGHQQVYQWLEVSGAILICKSAYLLSKLPVPVTTTGSKMSHAAALEQFGGSLVSENGWGTAEKVPLLHSQSSYCTSTQWNTGTCA